MIEYLVILPLPVGATIETVAFVDISLTILGKCGVICIIV